MARRCCSTMVLLVVSVHSSSGAFGCSIFFLLFSSSFAISNHSSINILLWLVFFFLRLLQPGPSFFEKLQLHTSPSPVSVPGLVYVIYWIIGQSTSLRFCLSDLQKHCPIRTFHRDVPRCACVCGTCTQALVAPVSNLEDSALTRHFNVVALLFALWRHITCPGDANGDGMNGDGAITKKKKLCNSSTLEAFSSYLGLMKHFGAVTFPSMKLWRRAPIFECFWRAQTTRVVCARAGTQSFFVSKHARGRVARALRVISPHYWDKPPFFHFHSDGKLSQVQRSNLLLPARFGLPTRARSLASGFAWTRTTELL